ncbi:MAG: ADP-glyceromanno-heptose 6-epimerase, partial [Candidatus Bathyarchaeota archaeon]|nr:ADP-glyceromanno-heptose 6-epimerase [Candidatus Bathyarchaeota archaeon]
VTLLNKILGKDIKPKYVVNPLKNYVNLTLADTTKAENVLGFKTKFSLEEGIKDYMAEEPPS